MKPDATSLALDSTKSVPSTQNSGSFTTSVVNASKKEKKKPLHSLLTSRVQTRPVTVLSNTSAFGVSETLSLNSFGEDGCHIRTRSNSIASESNTPRDSTPASTTFELPGCRTHSDMPLEYFSVSEYVASPISTSAREKPRLEHWPLPSWPAEDPNRLKLRDLIIEKTYALGCGDQGTVFYATHKVTNKAYAVKELFCRVEDSRETLRNTFRRELVTLYRQVDTQHVLRVFDVYVSGARMRLLMELMELGSLVDVLDVMKERRIRPRTPDCACTDVTAVYCSCPLRKGELYGRLCNADLQHVAHSIMHALHSIHSKNIIHRDLKPSNVLVDRFGVVKLSDFGVSRLLGEDGGVATTTTGSQLYFAPERVTNVQGYDYKADVWSAGVLLAYCAVGRYPMEGKLFDILTYITSRDFRLTLPPELHLCPSFLDFVSKCSVPDPATRPTAHEMLQHEFLHRCYHTGDETSCTATGSCTVLGKQVPQFIQFVGENDKLERLRLLSHRDTEDRR